MHSFCMEIFLKFTKIMYSSIESCYLYDIVYWICVISIRRFQQYYINLPALWCLTFCTILKILTRVKWWIFFFWENCDFWSAASHIIYSLHIYEVRVCVFDPFCRLCPTLFANKGEIVRNMRQTLFLANCSSFSVSK